MIEIVVNEEDMSVSAGDFTYKLVKKLHWSEIARRVTGVDHIKDPVHATKRGCFSGAAHADGKVKWGASIKRWEDILGCHPAKFGNIFNGAVYRLWVGDHKGLLYKYCYRGYGFDQNCLETFHSNKDLALQMVEDKQYNLLPFLFEGLFEDEKIYSIKDFKTILGKGLWKKLVSNSITRNKHMARCVDFVSTDTMKNFFSIANTLPSSYLQHTRAVYSFSVFVANNSKGFLTKKKSYKIGGEIYDLVNLAKDTENMANRLGLPYNNAWSVKRMKAEHDKYSKIITAQMYSKDHFSCIGWAPKEVVCEEGFTATLLTSPFEVAIEGKEMRHCVAGYSNTVEKGKYLVYSVTNTEGEKVSTLGLSKPPHVRTVMSGTPWVFSQHYGKSNTPVRCVIQKALAQDTIEKVNNNWRKYNEKMDNICNTYYPAVGFVDNPNRNTDRV